jgi:RNA polymerase sigma-70 factor (sigma-E family)
MAPRSDADEFTQLVGRRWHALVRTAMLLGCSPAEAEDVAQTTLTRCYRHWSRVRSADDPDAYVHRVLVNTFVDTTRRRSRGEVPVATPTDVVLHDADHDVRLDIERALGRLSTDQRLVVVLRYYLDLSEHQTATVLGVPPGTVKSRLARGLASLAGDLRAEPDEKRGPR